jgi:energy-coupling factor transporter ATP-binding protein EcfA2
MVGTQRDDEVAAALERRRIEQEAADERATRVLKRVGLVLLALLAAWVVVVFVGFLA